MLPPQVLESLLLLVVLSLSTQVASASLALKGCPDKCGNLTVPYPFGTMRDCSKDEGFLLICNSSFNPPRLFLETPNSSSQVSQVTFDNLTISYTQIARHCFPLLPGQNAAYDSYFNLVDLPYTLSFDLNRITVIGCDSVGLFTVDNASIAGCLSFCSNTSVILDGACSGEGCCQGRLQKGTKWLRIQVLSLLNHTTTRNISNCSVAFPVQHNWYNFKYADVVNFTKTEVPVVLEWAIGNKTCAEVRGSEGFACVGGNTTCVDSESGEGYRCHCMDGYEGNPYLLGGCQDIDECVTMEPCSHICTNTPGNYTCSCPKGMSGDGRKDGKGCSSNFPARITIFGVGLFIVIIVVGAASLYWVRRKMRYILLKERYFKKNGGLLLQQQMLEGEETTGIFNEDELKVATAGFSESRVLGRGGNGTVYKGFLPDEKVVAIKKSKVVEQTQMDQFINEIVILSRVIHKNVVKVLGCCLETEVPLLVYEYIPNGTLFDHIHRKDGQHSILSWEKRLRISAETAGAIAYLHSGIEKPIIHRDIKTANVLLDNNFTAKVADFGASRLVPLDEVEAVTMVQGTLGYLDPEYLQTGHLTDKSDVYSFGVVLAELLTGEKSISFPREKEQRNLAIHFLVTMKKNRLVDILDFHVREEGNKEQVMAVAQIAKRCLAMKGEERPTMEEVAAELLKLTGYGVNRSIPIPISLDVDDSSRNTNLNTVVHWIDTFDVEDDVDSPDEIYWSTNSQC